MRRDFFKLHKIYSVSQIKKFRKNVRIDFSFPFTMLVGKNGTGKSSVLHAIYGMPANSSTGEYWFTTDVDPIADAENCYFYGYQKDKNKRSFEKETTECKSDRLLGNGSVKYEIRDETRFQFG